MEELSLGLVGAVVGVLVVGPALGRAILAWVGRRVVVPVLLGRDPAPGDVAAAPACCAGCGAVVERRVGPVALLPFVAVGGRCRACGWRRPAWTGAVEAATGLGFGLAAARFGWSAELPAVLALVAGLVAVSAVDVVYLRIPTPFVYAAGVAVAGGIALAAVVAGPAEAVVGAGLGAAAYGGFLGLFWLVAPSGIGFGDVRLAVLIGAVVGWLGWHPDHPVEGPLAGVLGAAFAAGLVGTVVGTALLIARRQSRPFAFGPAMALGAVAAVLAAGPLG